MINKMTISKNVLPVINYDKEENTKPEKLFKRISCRIIRCKMSDVIFRSPVTYSSRSIRKITVHVKKSFFFEKDCLV